MSPQLSTMLKTNIHAERPGHCDLMINYTTVTDAGTYECLRHTPSPVSQTEAKHIVVRAIKLTVLGKNCIAHFNAYFKSPLIFDFSVSVLSIIYTSNVYIIYT